MKKKDLASLAMIGISAGLLVAGCQQKGDKNSNTAAAEQMAPDMQAFYNSLSPDAQKKFDQLDASHKSMAMQMTQQSCNGKNSCKAMGGCKTDTHSCAGQNSCAGKGGAPVTDPNKAVAKQYDNQMKK